MKKFKYRLERFLDLKKYNERKWEQKLASAAGISMRIKNRIAHALREKEAVFMQRYEKKDFDIDRLIYMEHFINSMGKKVEHLKVDLEKSEKKRMEIKKGYLKAAKERKVLEKLKEKESSKYYKKILNEEEKAMDDINSSRASRKLAGA